ncbi:MAG: hypothetical protein H0V43_07195 [Gemmatimonadales bacterium]|nr:hypothetical protein [Gemmatimonadales bacterium]
METTAQRIREVLQAEGFPPDAVSPEMLINWKLGEALDELTRVIAAVSNAAAAQARRREFAESRMLEKAGGQVSQALWANAEPGIVKTWRWIRDWYRSRQAAKRIAQRVAEYQAQEDRAQPE